MTTKSEDEIREELLKLTVGKGGVPSHRELAPDWEISFYENGEREDREDPPYVLVLRFFVDGKRREQKVLLRREQVHTRTRSMWKRDSVWRLTPESAATFATQIAAAMRKVAARGATTP